MRFKKNILPFIALLATISSFGQKQQTNLTTVEITISGMACQEGCADAINENIKNLTGVQNSEVSFEIGKAIVSYDSLIIPIDSIKQKIIATKVKNYNYVIEAIQTKQ